VVVPTSASRGTLGEKLCQIYFVSVVRHTCLTKLEPHNEYKNNKIEYSNCLDRYLYYYRDRKINKR